VDYPAPCTFATKTEAEKWLARIELDISDDQWLDPCLGKAGFGEYAAAWIRERPGLRPNTVRVHGYVLARHLQPFFAARPSPTSRRLMFAAGVPSCWTLALVLLQSPRPTG
jgi:hypothetical protein